MTDNVKLLPLPEMVEVDKHLPTGVSIYAYDANTLKDYALACVAYHTAALDTECQTHREAHHRIDGILMGANVFEVVHEGGQVEAWKNTIEAVKKLAAQAAENARLKNALQSLLRYVERCREAGMLVCDDIGPEEFARYELAQAGEVDEVAWRDAFIAERARRYRSEGMKIEQARIHAETDAALTTALTAQQTAAPDVVRLVEAARNLRRRQREYLEQPKGERDESKGRLVGDAARELDEALAPFTADQHKEPKS